MTSANDFLMSGGTTSAKFPEIGATVTGSIIREPEVQQQRDFQTGEPKFWDDGKPMQQLQVVLSTDQRDPENPDDEGERAVYIKGQMQKAVREAVRKSGAKGLAVGGKLTVTYTADGEAKGRLNPPKIYAAAYEPPSVSAEFLAGPAEPEQAAPAPAATPAAPAGIDPALLAALSKLSPAEKAAMGLG